MKKKKILNSIAVLGLSYVLMSIVWAAEPSVAIQAGGACYNVKFTNSIPQILVDSYANRELPPPPAPVPIYPTFTIKNKSSAAISLLDPFSRCFKGPLTSASIGHLSFKVPGFNLAPGQSEEFTGSINNYQCAETLINSHGDTLFFNAHVRNGPNLIINNAGVKQNLTLTDNHDLVITDPGKPRPTIISRDVAEDPGTPCGWNSEQLPRSPGIVLNPQEPQEGYTATMKIDGNESVDLQGVNKGTCLNYKRICQKYAPGPPGHPICTKYTRGPCTEWKGPTTDAVKKLGTPKINLQETGTFDHFKFDPTTVTATMTYTPVGTPGPVTKKAPFSFNITGASGTDISVT